MFLAFILLNIVACFHAYRFTHFSELPIDRTGDPKQLPTLEKVKTALLGVNNPRPTNSRVPRIPSTTVRMGSNEEIEGWLQEQDESQGLVILFHGYAASRSSLLEKAEVLHRLGYAVLLVDFMGSGGSLGNRTTLGYLEADQVRTVFDHARSLGWENIWLGGSSMGAVSIMKAVKDHQLDAKGLILECPFGSMREAVSSRFRNMGLPSFPLADLLTFWGGIINGFWAHGHVPIRYAKQIEIPVLLLYGEQDDRVGRHEMEAIAENLAGPAEFKSYPLSGHEDYLIEHGPEWTQDVSEFLDRTRECQPDIDTR